MTVPIPSGGKVVVFGDSITFNNWYVPLQNQYISSQFGGLLGAPYSAVQTPFGAALKPTCYPAVAQPTWINSGHSGDCIQDVIPLLATRVYAYDPFDVLIIQFVVNDTLVYKNNARPSLTPAQTQIDATTLVSTLRARYPTKPMAWVGGWAVGESSPQGANIWDADLDDRCARIAAICATYNITYVDLRAAYFAAEVANNPGAGLYLTIDGVHPSAIGQNIMGVTANPLFTVTR